MKGIAWRVGLAFVWLGGSLAVAESSITAKQLSVLQAGPGEDVQVTMGMSAAGCEGMKVRVGSRPTLKPTCEVSDDSSSVLTFLVPEDAARGPQRVTFERSGAKPIGTVEFEVLPREEIYLVARPLTMPVKAFDVNTDILGRLRRNLVLPQASSPFPGLSPSQKRDLSSLIPSNLILPPVPALPTLPKVIPIPPFLSPPVPVPPGQSLPVPSVPGLSPGATGTLPELLPDGLPPVLRSQLELLKRRFQIPPASFSRSGLPVPVVGPLGGEVVPTSVTPPSTTAVKKSTEGFVSLSLGYSNQICGQDLRVLEKNNFPYALLKYVAQLERVRKIDVVTAPDTLGKPPGLAVPQADPAAFAPEIAKNAEGWASIGRGHPDMQRNGGGANVVVFVLDTLAADGSDSAQNDRDEHGRLLPPGHGTWIRALILELAPSVAVQPVQVCDSQGCRMHRVIQGLCQAAAYSRTHPDQRVIVNMSLSTPYSSKMLEYAVEDAVRAGVAVVVAFGNVTPCVREGHAQVTAYTRADRCNAYPATDTAAAFMQPGLGLYSVGATTQNNRETAVFQRGQGIYEAKEMQVKLKYAPRELLTEPTVSAPGRWWMADNGYTYEGTSYSTPLVVAGLALWAERHPQCETWPIFDNTVRQLYLPNLMKRPCPGAMPSPPPEASAK